MKIAIFMLCFCCLAACRARKEELSGFALNTKLGPVLLVDGEPICLDRREALDDATAGRLLRVEGRLTSRDDDPAFVMTDGMKQGTEPIPQGIPGDTEEQAKSFSQRTVLLDPRILDARPGPAVVGGQGLRLTYSDGNGNTYLIVSGGGEAIVEYQPVRPKTSSSGRYRGGADFSGRLDRQHAQRIVELAQTALASLGVQGGNRVLGSGWLRLETASAAVERVLPPQAPERIDLEAALRELIAAGRQDAPPPQE